MGPAITTQGSRVVYRNAWMSVREDSIRLQDGSSGIYGVVDKPDFALVVPRQPDGGFWLVEQYRYPVQARYWEFPQGTWSNGRSGTAEELARAELAEETGLVAGSLTHLGRLQQAYGYSAQGFDVFLATNLVEGQPCREPTEADMDHRLVSRSEFISWVSGGKIVDAASVAAFALLELSGL